MLQIIFAFLLAQESAQGIPTCNSTAQLKVGLTQMKRILWSRYWTASHIEDDMGNPNGLLVSSYSRVMTLDITTNQSITIFGSSQSGHKQYPGLDAEFEDITGFRQVDNMTILAVDSKNHCLRLLNRVSYSTWAKAGLCEDPGRTDGKGDNARFSSPQFIIDGQFKNEYFVTDSGNGAIRAYNHETLYVGTLIDNLQNPKEMVLNQNRTYIFVTVAKGVAKVNIASATQTMYNSELLTYGITRLPHTADIIVTLRLNNTLATLDESGHVIKTFCDGSHGSENGDSKTCQINRPSSVRFSYKLQALVIGAYSSLKRFDISYTQDGNECKVKAENMTLPIRPTSTPARTATTSADIALVSSSNTTTDRGSVTDRNLTTPTKNGGSVTDLALIEPTDSQDRQPLQMRDLAFITGVAGSITLLIVIILVLVTKLRYTKSRLKRIQQQGIETQRSLPTTPARSERAETNPYQSIPTESRSSTLSHNQEPIHGGIGLPPRRVQQLRPQRQHNQGRMDLKNRTSQTSHNSEGYQRMNNAYSNADELQDILRMSEVRRTEERMLMTLAHRDMEDDPYNIDTTGSSDRLLGDDIQNNPIMDRVSS